MKIKWESFQKNSNQAGDRHELIFSDDNGQPVERIELFDYRGNTYYQQQGILYSYFSIGNTLAHNYIVTPDYKNGKENYLQYVVIKPDMTLDEAKKHVVLQLILAYDNEICKCNEKIEKIVKTRNQKSMYKENLQDFLNNSTERFESLSQPNPQVADVLVIADRKGLTADDLQSEAGCVEEFGEWIHMSLLGYSSECLREAAKILRRK